MGFLSQDETQASSPILWASILSFLALPCEGPFVKGLYGRLQRATGARCSSLAAEGARWALQDRRARTNASVTMS